MKLFYDSINYIYVIGDSLCICSKIDILYVLYFIQDGDTPLHKACDESHKETAIALIDRGANIHMKNNVSI